MKLEASHARALDIYYECVGNDVYTFYVKFYRDCNGINAPTSVRLYFQSQACGNTFNVLLPTISGPVDVSQLCPAQMPYNTCNGNNTHPGTQEYIYSTTVQMPAQCNDWRIYNSGCCRNSAIDNIVTPSNQGWYIEATMDNTNNQCNNSPQYSNNPILYGCVGQPLCFNHGATDPDSDSLSFEMVVPKEQGGIGGVNLPYAAGFSLSNPMSSSTPITFDQNTGQLCLTPSTIQQGVIAIKTYEWKKIGGVYVNTSYSIREMQLIIVGNCSSVYAGDPIDTITVNTGTLIDTMTVGVCEGQTVDFDMLVTDPNPMTNYVITTNAAIATPNATVTMTGSNPVNLHYNWATTPGSAGQYLVSLTVDNTDCPIPRVIFRTLIIQVHESVVMDLPDSSICGNSIALDATVTGSSYLWSTGNTDSVITVNSDGLYWVELNKGQCTVRDSMNIAFYDSTNADFSVLSGCLNDPSVFNDLSGNTTNQWFWNFGDGGSSTQQNPLHTYASAGTYNVQLISSNSLICQDTISKSVLVEAPLNPNIGPDISQCGGSVTLNGGVGQNVNYTWNNGLTDSAQTINNSGTYWLEIEHNGCIERDSVDIDIFSLPVSGFIWTGNCTDTSILFNDQSVSNISSWQWDFGDGGSSTFQNPQHTYASAGTYNTSLYVTDINGCIDSFITTISIDSAITIDLGADSSQCGGSIFIDGYAGPGLYTWSNGISNTSTTINSSGLYWLELDNNGCKDRDSIDIDIFSLPNSNFSWIGGCTDTAITFSDLSSSNTQVWSWDFGDGNTSSLQNPNNQYSGNGTFLITLNIVDSNGCEDSVSYNITIDTAVTVDLGADTSLCGGNLDINAYVGSGVIYAWSNGSADSLINVDTTGIYSVMVDNNGCIGMDTIDVIVLTPPQTLFNNIGHCQKDTIEFNDLSVANPMNWSWAFGDGSSDSIQNPTHVYSYPGTYQIDLTLTDSNGCIDNYSTLLIIDQVYDIDLGVDTNLCGGSLLLDASVGANVNYTWSTGQIDSAIIASVSAIYSVEIDNNGCKSRDSIVVKVMNVPTALFSSTAACQNKTIIFTDSSLYNVTTWTWDFGDGNFAYIPSPNHSYISPGTYALSLSIIDTNGCVDTNNTNIVVDTAFVLGIDNDTILCQDTLAISAYGPANANYSWSNSVSGQNITVDSSGVYVCIVSRGGCTEQDSIDVTLFDTPIADFALPLDSCNNTIHNFTNTSTGSIVQWNWNISNGNSYITQDITTNLDSGSYTIELIVENIDGCSDTMLKSISIIPIELELGNDTTLCGGNLLLNAQLSYSVNYSWSDGSSGSSLNVDSTGIYFLEINNLGCLERDTISVIIHAPPVANYSYSGGCELKPIDFFDQSIGSPLYWVWNFGDGNISSDQNPSHSYANHGNYSVILQIVDSNLCTHLVGNIITIDSSFSLIMDPDTSLCATNLDITAHAPINANYFWSNNAVTSTTNVNISGLYVVTVTRGSCTETDTIDITLLDIPNADFSLPQDSCDNVLHEIFDNSSSDVIHWTWLIDSVFSDSTQNMTDTLPAGLHNVQLIVTTAYGCKDNIIRNINIIPAVASGAVSNDTIVYENYPAEIWASGGQSYVWSPSITLDDAYRSDPTAISDETTYYYVTITDQFGCVITDSVLVEILDDYQIYIPSAFTPNADGKNDLYRLGGNGIMDFYMILYNRYGEIVFETSDINDSWDGYFRGKEADSGTFAYYITIKYMNQDEKVHKGSFTLYR